MNDTEDVRNAGEPRMGDSIEDIRNVSAVPMAPRPPGPSWYGDTVGPTRRLARDPRGRWKPRESKIVGPLNKPTGAGGIDTVTGQWIPGVRDNSQLNDVGRVHEIAAGRQYFESPDYSGNVDPERKSNTHGSLRDALISHVMGCAACATEGAVCCGG
jgi:hypothetical protein